jgi:hypothetical protein
MIHTLTHTHPVSTTNRELRLRRPSLPQSLPPVLPHCFSHTTAAF